MTDLISIIIPIYKVETYLRDCLVSIQRQRFSNFEVLLINDGSPDNSEEICLDFVKYDHRYKYFHKKNGGVSSARNFGLEKATGKWICFVDADDSVDMEYLNNMITNATNSEVLVITDFNRVGSSKSVKNYLKIKPKLIDLKNNYCQIFDHINYLEGNPVNKLFHRETIIDNNLLFDEKQSFGEDRLFYYEYLKYIKYLNFIEKSDYNYFYRESSSISKKHSSNDYLKLIIGENTIISNCKINNEDFKKRYTKLFLSLIRAINSENDSLAQKSQVIKGYSAFIKTEHLVKLNKRLGVLVLFFSKKKYKLLFFLLNYFLK